MSKATEIIDDALENHWLNLHEGGHDDDANEFQKAWDAVPVLDREQVEFCFNAIDNLTENKTDDCYCVVGGLVHDLDTLRQILAEGTKTELAPEKLTNDDLITIKEFVLMHDTMAVLNTSGFVVRDY
tara:strand:- start:221 stop:601 length:381 start_codon:yes stop_codon:yes gene_type:complete